MSRKSAHFYLTLCKYSMQPLHTSHNLDFVKFDAIILTICSTFTIQTNGIFCIRYLVLYFSSSSHLAAYVCRMSKFTSACFLHNYCAVHWTHNSRTPAAEYHQLFAFDYTVRLCTKKIVLQFNVHALG